MNYKCRNYYKTCRENASFTQEYAAEMLFISVRSLSDYENGKTVPPDETVERMVDFYKTKLLGWWHLKNTSELAKKCLPDIQPPQTNADIYLQAEFSEDEILKLKSLIKHLLTDIENGKVTELSFESYEEIRELSRITAGKLMSISSYEPQMKQNSI